MTQPNTFYLNPWLTLARRRRLESQLRLYFMGKKYRECAKELTMYAHDSDDWQEDFIIYSSVDSKDQIDSIEVQEAM